MAYFIVKYRLAQICFYVGNIGIFVAILVVRFDHYGRACCGDLVQATNVLLGEQAKCLRVVIIYMSVMLVVAGMWLVKNLRSSGGSEFSRSESM